DVAATASDHEWREASNAVIDTAKVRVDDAFPFGRRKLMQRRSEGADSGVVHENVEATEGAFNTLCRRFHGAQIRNIALDDGALSAAILNCAGSSLKIGACARA